MFKYTCHEMKEAFQSESEAWNLVCYCVREIFSMYMARFAILIQRDMPDELRLTSAQYENVTFNAYHQAALNSGNPDRHITHDITHEIVHD